MRVLVVDDSSYVRRRLCELLAEDGEAEVSEAADVARARELLDSSPEVIVLDIAGVVALGESALDLIREFKTRVPQAVLIVLTNHSSDVHRRECLQRGADHFFDKSRQFEAAIGVARAARRPP